MTTARAADFSLVDMEGRNYSLRELSGRGPVLLAFFKVSCPTCQYTFPFLQRLSERLAGSSATLAGISQDAVGKTKEFNQEYGVRFPVLLDPAEENYPVSNAYRITHVPTLFLIEPDGRIALTSEGFAKRDLEEIAGRLGPVPLFDREERVEDFRPG